MIRIIIFLTVWVQIELNRFDHRNQNRYPALMETDSLMEPLVGTRGTATVVLWVAASSLRPEADAHFVLIWHASAAVAHSGSGYCSEMDLMYIWVTIFEYASQSKAGVREWSGSFVSLWRGYVRLCSCAWALKCEPKAGTCPEARRRQTSASCLSLEGINSILFYSIFDYFYSIIVLFLLLIYRFLLFCFWQRPMKIEIVISFSWGVSGKPLDPESESSIQPCKCWADLPRPPKLLQWEYCL